MSELKNKAEEFIAQGTGTYSKRWDQFVEGVYPTHVTRSDGEYIFDDAGKKYVDTMCGCGANLDGHYNTYSLPSVLEVILADKLVQRVDCIDKVKFLKTGSEACQAAVRIARANSGVSPKQERAPSVVLGLGYHGHHSVFISAEDPGAGCFYEKYVKEYSIESMINTINSPGPAICAVIIEPVMLDYNVQDDLRLLREVCTENGICLIFDEVITGGRFKDFCVSNHFSIKPDLICLGKAIGNGHPIAIVGGSKKYMDTPDYFISSTFSGEESAIASAIKTLDSVTNEELDNLWNEGNSFKEEFNTLSEKIKLNGHATRYVWAGEEEYIAIFWQEMLKKGWLCGKAFFVNFSFINKMQNFLIDSAEVINRIEDGGVGLEGLLPRPVFKRN